jgi:hypothetical protein
MPAQHEVGGRSAACHQASGARMIVARVSCDYFFVVGCPRSGTTLLSVLLDRHSRVCVPPETNFFDEVAPALGDRDEARLLDVLRGWARMPELGLEPADVVRRVAGRAWTPGDVLAAVLDLCARTRGRPRAGEKTPRHLLHVPTILQQLPHTRVVCVLRDGRETALSLHAMPWWPHGLAAAAELWKERFALAQHFERAYRDRFTIVRYEDLVSHPEAMLSAVMTYLGETFEPTQLRPDVPSRVVLPRSMAWKGDALGLITAARVGARYRGACAQDRELLDRVFGPA